MLILPFFGFDRMISGFMIVVSPDVFAGVSGRDGVFSCRMVFDSVYLKPKISTVSIFMISPSFASSRAIRSVHLSLAPVPYWISLLSISL